MGKVLAIIAVDTEEKFNPYHDALARVADVSSS